MGRQRNFGQGEATFRPHQPEQRSSGAMAGVRSFIAWLGLAALSGCSGASAPPPELAGLWSAGPAACEAGVGIRFTSDAIEAVYEAEHETLFAHPKYDVEHAGEDFRVRITYALPRPHGGPAVAGAHGVLVLARDGAGIAPAAHTLIDHRTGAARMRIGDDPAVTAMTLQPCGRHPWRDDLRGLTT